MIINITGKKKRDRETIAWIAIILVGLTLLISGTGKLLEFGMVPGQTADFIGSILPDALLSSTTMSLIYNVLIPYIIPGIELVLGISLLIGFVPRLIAAICIPLTWIFMANNIFSISQGLSKYAECPCFGIWGDIFGAMTPTQSLVYDIVLLGLALVIIFMYADGFLQSNIWLRNLKKKEESNPNSNT